MYFMINGEIAVLYGLPEALFIHNIYWWTAKNEANGKHLYDGKTWTYNSMKAFAEMFPFWSEAQIKRIIKKLSSAGAIHVGNFNKKGFDRTQWYAVSDEVERIYKGQNRPFHCAESSIPLDGIVPPIPDSKPDSKPDIPPLPPKGENDGFEKFWIEYPRKTARATALKSWKKIKPDAEMQETILSALEQHKKTEQWTRDKGQFIPHPATWLNQCRWQDELESTVPQPVAPARLRKFERREVDGEWVDVEVFD